MEAVREVTVWTGVAYRQPNHDYLLEGNRIVAYRPWGTGPIHYLKSGLKIDRRGRKFVKLDPNIFDEHDSKDPMVVEVQGSKGNSYFVNIEERTCTCPGFGFRGRCKHVQELVK